MTNDHHHNGAIISARLALELARREGAAQTGREATAEAVCRTLTGLEMLLELEAGCNGFLLAAMRSLCGPMAARAETREQARDLLELRETIRAMEKTAS